tara:strand:+ start:44845 stop:46740 length:1896 start_codon:yes stop_codon:yes gene_type:complete
MMNNPIIYIMGVSGSGKSTIGKLLANELSLPFFDGDDFHTKENIKKMSKGNALNDNDRVEWLQLLNSIAKKESNKAGAIIVSSALKENYREILSSKIDDVFWVYLKGDFDTIQKRLEFREHEYMPSSLLKSQFETLEEPDYGIHINITLSPEQIIYRAKAMISNNSEFGLIGLGVMGKSLSRNLAKKGFHLSLFNRHLPKSEEKVAEKFIEKYSELSNAKGFENLSRFVDSLESPKKIFLMVQAGDVTDAVINNLVPLLRKGDIIIDGGNSHYKDTERRINYLSKQGIHILGVGVSGGEDGALNGPSIMASGEIEVYKKVSIYLESIAAKDIHGNACCTLIGKGGSGHFVKMVHNGIEYAEMQLLAETYHFLRYGKGLNPSEISDIFERWRQGDLDSYLLEITVDILRKKEGDEWLIDLILDKAGNKGTGSWTTIAAAELGVPATMISSALFARYLSSFKEERDIASYQYQSKVAIPSDLPVDQVGIAYQLARVINHHQGIHLLSAASKEYGWRIKLWEVARMWTNGCIIRSELMNHLVQILQETDRILFDELTSQSCNASKPYLDELVIETIKAGQNAPCLTSALLFLNGYTNYLSSANIIQAQRDYFGAHTYKRIDDPNGKSHHTIWKE